MEGLIILFVLAIVVAPIILSIVALVKVYSLQSKIDALQATRTPVSGISPTTRSEPTGESDPPCQESSPTQDKPTVVKALEREVVVSESSETNRALHIASAKPMKTSPAPSSKPGINLEILMGVKGAAFIGITILVIGISLLITYAIQNAWLGPGARSLLGIVSGAVLIGIGYFAEQKSKKYKLLTRVLTGGGGALFFVSVYAAFGMYHLIPAATAGLGLLACAGGVFSLAMVYRSQAVAILGVIGAFLVPILIGEGVGNPTFLLIYVALLNVPVILLGLKRKWQWLYNLGFLSTAFYYLEWSGLTHDQGESLWLGLGFSLLFFLQYAGLGLLKLWKESEVKGRELDTLRLLLGSLLLLAAVYSLLENNPVGDWMGFWFVGYAIVHVGLAAFGFRRFPHFTHEILAFLAGATLFATLALPAQLDGAWVSVGWALEGVIVAWMAAKARSSFFQILAFILGIIGIMKGLVFDFTLYNGSPDPFWNLRFWVGLVSAGLFALQGWIVQTKAVEIKSNGWHELFWWIAILGVLAVGVSDVFWTIGADEIESWIILSWIFLIVSGGIVVFAPRASSVRVLGAVILVLVPLVVLLFGIVFAFEMHDEGVFSHWWIWLELLTVVSAAVIAVKMKDAKKTDSDSKLDSRGYGTAIVLLSIASSIGLVSAELLRASESWGSMGVTLFWAISAIVLTLWGLSRKNRAYRYFGLALFVLCAGKVMLIDSTQLDGLQRILAYMGTGIMLLVLSFVYQKAASYFNNLQ